MAFPKTTSKFIRENGKTFTVYLVEFENAIFSFFFEGESRKIGTMAVATPRTSTFPGSSSLMLGYKNVNITRLLSEYLASKFQKIAVSSVFIYLEDDIHTNQILLKLAKSIEIPLT